MIFFSLTEAPLPEPTPTPPNGPETDPKRSQAEPNGPETEPNGAEMDRNQALSGGTARGGCRHGGGGGGCKGKRKSLDLSDERFLRLQLPWSDARQEIAVILWPKRASYQSDNVHRNFPQNPCRFCFRFAHGRINVPTAFWLATGTLRQTIAEICDCNVWCSLNLTMWLLVHWSNIN